MKKKMLCQFIHKSLKGTGHTHNDIYEDLQDPQ